MPDNPSPQATRDGRSSSAIAEKVVSPASLSWTLGCTDAMKRFIPHLAV